MNSETLSSDETQVVDVIDTPEALGAIKGAYRRVHRADADADVFLSWEWVSRIFAAHPGEWRIYAVRNEAVPGGYAGFLPLHSYTRWSASRGRFQTHLTDAGRLGQSAHTGFVCVPELEEEVLAVLGEHMALHPWSRLSLRFEPTIRRIFKFSESFMTDGFSVDFPQHYSDNGKTDLLPTAVLPLPADYQTYFGTLGANLRKTLRKSVERLRDFDDTRYTVTNPASYEKDREALLDLWSVQFEDTESERRIDALMQAHRDLLDRAQNAGLLYQVTLWQGTRVLCSIAHIVDRKTRSIHVLVEGRDAENDVLNTDLLLTVFAIQKAIAAGCTAYHFGHDAKDLAFDLGAKRKETAYLAVSRRSASAVDGFDPAMMGDALQRTERFIKKGDVDSATAAMAHIRTLWDQIVG